jgi:GNAT superfamily N-acetyltransferase
VPAALSPALTEKAEAEAYYSFEAGTPAGIQAAMGMQLERIGGGVVLAVRNDPTRFWSKVIGLGFDEPVTTALLQRVLGFYTDRGVSATVIQIAPSVLPADWPDICAKLHITPGGPPVVKLAGDISAAVAGRRGPGLGPGLRVGPVSAGQAAEWAAVMCGVFGFPLENQAEMAAASVGPPDWRAFAVWDDHRIVATAALHIFEKTGHLFGGATIPAARGRGAQSALIEARVQAAREAGCQWVIGETGAEAPGQHSASLHNMMRAGLQVRYERQNWTWRDPNR